MILVANYSRAPVDTQRSAPTQANYTAFLAGTVTSLTVLCCVAGVVDLVA